MRKLLLPLALTAATLLLMEVIVYVGLCLIDGGWATREALAVDPAASEISEGEEEDGGAEALAKVERELRKHAQWNYRMVLHPFVGAVIDPGHPANRKQAGYNPESAQYGFAFSAEPLMLEPPPETVVVGVFGGSVASIFGTAGRPALIRQLQSYPRFQGKQIAVVSLAAGGYKQPQQLMALNYLLSLGFHFDVVINLDGFNEVALAKAELQPQGIFPHFPRNWRQMTEGLDQELRMAIGRLEYLRARRAELAEGFGGRPWRWSWSAELVYRVLAARRAEALAEAEHALLALPGSQKESYQLQGPPSLYEDDAALYRDVAEVWRRSSLQMARLCAGLGIEYYHFLQPNQYIEGSKPLSDSERQIAWREDFPYRPGAVHGYPELQRQGEQLVRHGVSFHDATRVFADVEQTLYFDPCCHFNIVGNRHLARFIARVIGPASS